MVETCAECGRPKQGLSPDILTNSERRVFEFVNDHPGCKLYEIMDHLYADHPDGGPEKTEIVTVFICKANKKLKPLGMKITNTRGPGATYSVKVIE